MQLILAGFLWLGRFVVSFGGWIVYWFGKYVSKKIVTAASVTAALAVPAAAMYTGLNALISALIPVSPPWLSLAAQLFLPSNITVCISSIFGAHVIRWVYVAQYRAVVSSTGNGGND